MLSSLNEMKSATLLKKDIVGSGEDSVVYRQGRKVIKIYHNREYRPLLTKYDELTRAARALFEKDKIGGRVDVNGKPYTYRFEVVPIEKIGVTEEGEHYVIAEYVPGMRASSVFPSDISPGVRMDSAQQSNEYYDDMLHLGNKRKSSWFSRFRNALYTDPDLRSDFESTFSQVAERLETLNNREAYLCLHNIKLDVNLRTKHIRFAITDVCASIHRL